MIPRIKIDAGSWYCFAVFYGGAWPYPRCHGSKLSDSAAQALAELQQECAARIAAGEALREAVSRPPSQRATVVTVAENEMSLKTAFVNST